MIPRTLAFPLFPIARASAAHAGRWPALSHRGSRFQITTRASEDLPASAGGPSMPNGQLPSVEELRQVHREALNAGKGVKATFTTDRHTLDLASRILEGDPQESFMRAMLLTPRSSEVGRAGSKKVSFAPIEREPRHIQEAHGRLKGRLSLVCVGGPASIDAAVLGEHVLRRRLDVPIKPPTYVNNDFGESNLLFSAHQLHARHGTALNADPDLTGHALLGEFLERAVRLLTEAEVLEPDFRKVDLPLGALTPKKLLIYLHNELNGLRQVLRERTGFATEHDLNRIESLLSCELLRLTERLTGLQLSTTAGRDWKDSVAIHVDLTAQGRRATLEEALHLHERTGIESAHMTPQEMQSVFGEQAAGLAGATVYYGDGAFLMNGQQMLVDHLVLQGGKFREASVDRVLFFKDDETGHAKVAGIVTAAGEFIYASHLKLSLGYQADYRFAAPTGERNWRESLNALKESLGLHAPIPGHRLTTATGASVTALFHLSPHLLNLVEQRGFPQYAVTNSHWTLIARKGDKALVRITGGGNTGVEDYNPAYFLNLLANTERIFGADALIGIVSTYGCPRAINGRNSTEFAVSDGVVVSYGKGGTGNTKRHAEAVMSLCMLFPEWGKPLLQFLDGYATETGRPLGKVVEEIHAEARRMGFIDDSQAHLDRGLGYDRSLSVSEKLAAATFLLLIALAHRSFAASPPKKDVDRQAAGGEAAVQRRLHA